LRFEAGRITGLVGPAGSGKTALMRILAGFDRAEGGQVRLDGAPIGRLAPSRRGFGVVRQRAKLFSLLSLGENVALPLRLRRVGRRDREAMLRGALELAQLADAGHLRPHEASPSQVARALLARAAVTGPGVLLLDEIFAGVDGAFHAGLVSTVRHFHEMLGATTVVATRDLKLALPLTDSVVVLRDGAPVQIGTPLEVYERPAEAFVAMLAGECNSLSGIVQDLEDDMALIQLACGPVVEARSGGGLAVGAACRVVIRPEHIAVAAGTAADMGEGALDATCLETQFCGESTRLRLLIGSGAELLARRASAAGLRGVAPGRPVAVAWQSHHAVAFVN
jgi:putative spermidine/putrescine transport system ATP-binding protein